jgi:metal-responsive CopG/Arc/MetJ family transcriptional regulator
MGRKTKSAPATRASVTFPSEVYSSLESIAKKKKVSMAWVIRDAVEKYVSDRWPLFAGTKNEK